MSNTIDKQLKKLGIILPNAPNPAANYLPFVRTGNLIYVSGQIARNKDLLITGKLGLNMDIETAYKAARFCGLDLISQLSVACEGNLDRLKKIVRLGGFVNSTPEFLDHAKVINGASDLMVEIFGDKGKHARAAVGCSSLPLGVAVEVDGIFEIE